MDIFLEIAAHSVEHMFSLYLTICDISYFPLCFEDLILILIASVTEIVA